MLLLYVIGIYVISIYLIPIYIYIYARIVIGYSSHRRAVGGGCSGWG